MTKKLVLIDGFSIAFRAFYAVPLLSNTKGLHTNAIYGFVNILNKILQEENPTHVMVAFDAGRTTFRHEFFTEYKGGRAETPSELSEQFPFIRELLEVSGVSHYELPQYEADDIIGTLATRAEKDGFEVTVVSGDRDLTQLASDKTTVRITKKGFTETDDYTPAFVMEKYGITPAQIVDLKGLMGDSSDNIPGVPGVGEKTGLKLLLAHGSIEAVLDATDQISGKKLVENLTNFREQAMLSKRLATIVTDAPVTVELDTLAYVGAQLDQLRNFYRDLGMTSLLKKLDVEGFESEDASVELAKANYTIATDVSADMISSAETSLFIEVLDDNYYTGAMIGFAIANAEQTYYLPLEVVEKSALFKEWAENRDAAKVVFDAKKCIVVMKRLGIQLQGVCFDALLASYIFNPGEKMEDFASLARPFYRDAIQSDEQFYGKGAKLKIPTQEVLSEHIARKAIALQEIHRPIVTALQENHQYELLMDLELPLALILAEMEWTGITVDASRLEEMGIGLEWRLKEIEASIYDHAGEVFNISSPKQLGVILFEKLGLPSSKKTKTGYSTSADVLDELASKHPIVAEILLYRQLSKLQSTYVEGLLKVIHEDGKVHTRFNQALTQTGRLSSIDPNLQNIPIRLEEGRKIREAFVPSVPGWLIVAADYSQIELRVLAHIAGDAGLIAAFREEMDIHTKTAMDVFGVEAVAVTSDMRRQAKAVNFGIVYGISDYGLSQNLGITRREAKAFIEKYFDTFPGVQDYMKDIVIETKKNGYVTTLLQRRRYITDINSRNFNLRGFAERTAMNTPIQGSAADIIKLAMIRMNARLERENLQAKMLIQVHDELVFEAPESELEILKQIIPEEMSNAIVLVVPLKADFAFGKSWYEAK